MHQNLLNAEFVSAAYLNAVLKRAGYPVHSSAHKGAAQVFLLHICLPSIAFFGQMKCIMTILIIQQYIRKVPAEGQFYRMLFEFLKGGEAASR
jgi:hypothetical protein